MDYALAKELAGRFDEFITHFDGPEAFCGAPMTIADAQTVGNDDEELERRNREWVEQLRTIQRGFAEYITYSDNELEMATYDQGAEYERVMAGIRESFRLMGERYSGLWW
jgi:hypothetical protein